MKQTFFIKLSLLNSCNSSVAYTETRVDRSYVTSQELMSSVVSEMGSVLLDMVELREIEAVNSTGLFERITLEIEAND